MARTIYKVEGASKGEGLPDAGRPAEERLPEPAWAGGEAPGAASRLKRRRLLWILVGIAVLTIIMIAVIAALGASESPAMGTSLDSRASTALAIPVLGVDATMVPVGLMSGSSMEIPAVAEYDASTGHFLPNVVGYAHLVK